MRKSILAFVLAFAVIVPGTAMALTAFVERGGANVRLGPSTRFPVVLTLAAGSRVEIRGCLITRNWCQLNTRRGRAWIASSRLNFIWRGRRVLVSGNFTAFGAPIVQFNE